MKKIRIFFILMIIFILMTACNADKNHKVNSENTENISNRETILTKGNEDEKRNELLREDIEFLRKEFPKKHKNPFSIITEKEFNERLSNLYDNVDKLNNYQIFIELGKIIASVKDSHTSINYWDGKSYPLEFYMFDDGVYIINADKSLEDMVYSKLVSIDNIEYKDIISELTQQIAYVNEGWLKYMLPNYLSPAYLYGLGIGVNKESSVFRVEREGELKDFEVPILSYAQTANLSNNRFNDKITGKFGKYYDYKYMKDNKALYFEYNVCANDQYQRFAKFNASMFEDIESKDIDKIIIDLRCNAGGNSEILNPFTNKLKSYIKENKDTKVYVLVGRQTFSSGMFAIFRIKEAAPKALFIGESTGGAINCYGEILSFNLPNSQIPIQYSTKYFEFSKTFKYEVKEMNAFVPEILLSPSIDDYINENDAVLEYVLNN